MSLHDDDPLAAYDLSAWDAPPPAPGLVDKVIERARQAAPVAALDSGERIATPVRGNRRWWIAATVAAVAVVAVLFGVWGVQRTPKDGQGEVTASAARKLAIGPTTATLDPGTQVRWRRDKRRVSVAQPRGAALWSVAADDTLVIDAGAMVATVEASGASLRVEVEMNRSDARAVGISAATAVAVALVTIVVYEGTVRVRHGGQTVNVVPGASYEVRPANAPEPIAVGGGPVDPRIRELEAQIKQFEAERDALMKRLAGNTCDEVACVLDNYAGECCQKFKKAPPKQADVPEMLTRATFNDVMTALTPKIFTCPTDGYVGTAKVKVVITPAGTVADTTSIKSTGNKVGDKLMDCVERLIVSARFPATLVGGTFDQTYAFPADGKTCNADALRQKGDDHLATGMDAAALVWFEKSQACRPDGGLDRKAYMAACRSKNPAKAQAYFAKLPEGQREMLAPICLRLGIDPGTPCKADSLREQGDDHLGAGMYAAASASYEKSLECKQDPVVTRKAYMAACKSKNAVLARKYFAAMPTSARTSVAQICIREGIAVDDSAPSGVIKILSKPPAKILLDGVDTGQTTPATVQTTPGRHKITYVVGNDKYTFAVTVKEGETVTQSKELE